MSDKPRVIAWMMDAPIADDDPYRAIKLRARDLVAAAEVLELAARDAEVGIRADAVGQAADLMMSEAFDLGDTWDAAEAAGMTPGQLDAAGNVALELWRIEHLRG